MGNTDITRRDFFSRAAIGAPPKKGKKDPSQKDPFQDAGFRKYANTSLPVARVQSGTDVYTGQWTVAEIRHLLRRVTFGASKISIDQLTGMSLTDAVNLLIDNPPLPGSSPLNIYQDIHADTLGVPADASWVYFNVPYVPDLVLDFYRLDYSFKPWWHGLMINQGTHILEKIKLFWANHFSTQTIDIYNAIGVWQLHNTIHANCLGNFRTLLKLVTTDPHMLMFLNGNSNSASAPDENYARELQELFTVGKGPNSAYTEDDVKQAAKVLTGWRRTEQSNGFPATYFNDAEHDSTDKQFSAFYGNTIIKGRSGQDGQYETDDLINMLLATDEAAKYICRCIYRWFVYYVIDDTVEANVIAPLADILRNGNYEIAPVLKALFTSDHFFDPLNRGCIIKSPVDFYTGYFRELNIKVPLGPPEITYSYWLHVKDRCVETGQKIGDPPNVAGWPAYYQQPVYYESWIYSDSIQRRASAINTYASINGYALDNGLKVVIDSISFSQQFPHSEDPNMVVSNFADYLLPLPVSDADLAAMKTVLLNNQASDHYFTDAWFTYLNDTTNVMNETIVRERLNALISYITSLEEYQLF